MAEPLQQMSRNKHLMQIKVWAFSPTEEHYPLPHPQRSMQSTKMHAAVREYECPNATTQLIALVI